MGKSIAELRAYRKRYYQDHKEEMKEKQRSYYRLKNSPTPKKSDQSFVPQRTIWTPYALNRLSVSNFEVVVNRILCGDAEYRVSGRIKPKNPVERQHSPACILGENPSSSGQKVNTSIGSEVFA